MKNNVINNVEKGFKGPRFFRFEASAWFFTTKIVVAYNEKQARKRAKKFIRKYYKLKNNSFRLKLFMIY